ncbi:MAG: alpha/beta fold hydrolase [Bryobacteraceae bacterium]
MPKAPAPREGISFSSLAELILPEWRVTALDQRRYGHSSHGNSYVREDYLGDIEGLFDHLHFLITSIWNAP